jgi:hypothetical protein
MFVRTSLQCRPLILQSVPANTSQPISTSSSTSAAATTTTTTSSPSSTNAATPGVPPPHPGKHEGRPSQTWTPPVQPQDGSKKDGGGDQQQVEFDMLQGGGGGWTGGWLHECYDVLVPFTLSIETSLDDAMSILCFSEPAGQRISAAAAAQLRRKGSGK